jgi:hypothetical protein
MDLVTVSGWVVALLAVLGAVLRRYIGYRESVAVKNIELAPVLIGSLMARIEKLEAAVERTTKQQMNCHSELAALKAEMTKMKAEAAATRPRA